MRMAVEQQLRRAIRQGDDDEIAEIVSGLNRFERDYTDIESIAYDVRPNSVRLNKIQVGSTTIRDRFGVAEVES